VTTGQLRFDLDIIKVTKEKLDLWDFENWDWLIGNSDNLRIFFIDTVKRLDELMEKEGKKQRYIKLKIDAEKRLRGLKGDKCR
jgi:hypothetical protein